jgi:MYXO-CTERM domain-containing protein
MTTAVAARVRAASGSAVDATSPVWLRDFTGEASGPAAASDGTNFLVAWIETRSGSSPAMYGTRLVPSDATLLDKTGPDVGIHMADVSGYGGVEGMLWDGLDCVVEWSQAPSINARRADLFLSRFTSALAPLDGPSGAGFLFRGGAIAIGMGMASSGQGRLLGAYPVLVESPGQLGVRIRARFVKDDGLPGDGGVVVVGDDGGDGGGGQDAAAEGGDAAGVEDGASGSADAPSSGDGAGGQAGDSGVGQGSDSGGTDDGATGSGDAAADGMAGGPLDGSSANGGASDAGGGGGSAAGGCGCRTTRDTPLAPPALFLVIVVWGLAWRRASKAKR